LLCGAVKIALLVKHHATRWYRPVCAALEAVQHFLLPLGGGYRGERDDGDEQRQRAWKPTARAKLVEVHCLTTPLCETGVAAKSVWALPPALSHRTREEWGTPKLIYRTYRSRFLATLGMTMAEKFGLTMVKKHCKPRFALNDNG
jgi:hypothetical protein